MKLNKISSMAGGDIRKHFERSQLKFKKSLQQARQSRPKAASRPFAFMSEERKVQEEERRAKTEARIARSHEKDILEKTKKERRLAHCAFPLPAFIASEKLSLPCRPILLAFSFSLVDAVTTTGATRSCIDIHSIAASTELFRAAAATLISLLYPIDCNCLVGSVLFYCYCYIFYFSFVSCVVHVILLP